MDEKAAVRIYNDYTKQFKKKLGTRFMYSDRLEEVGQKYIPRFRGVFAKDNIDYRILQSGDTCLVNTQNSWEPGEHWVGVACNAEDVIICYDSFGRPGRGLLDIKQPTADTDRDPEQSSYEVDCGPRSLGWCLLFSQDPAAAMKI